MKTTPSSLRAVIHCRTSARAKNIGSTEIRRHRENTEKYTGRRPAVWNFSSVRCPDQSRYAQSVLSTTRSKLAVAAAKRQQRFIWTSCFCESIQVHLQDSSRSASSCGMGTSGQADRSSCQSLGAAVQWFRVWLWVLLWAVLTSGVEPSQRAAGGTAPCVDLQVQALLVLLLCSHVSAECTRVLVVGYILTKQGWISATSAKTAAVVPCAGRERAPSSPMKLSVRSCFLPPALLGREAGDKLAALYLGVYNKPGNNIQRQVNRKMMDHGTCSIESPTPRPHGYPYPYRPGLILSGGFQAQSHRRTSCAFEFGVVRIQQTYNVRC